MNRKSNIAFALFLIVTIGHLTGLFFGYDFLQVLTKPMLMLSLMVLYGVSVSKVNKWYVLALVFSFFGDVFLIDKSGYFLFGLGAFLIAQLIYIKIVATRLEGLASKTIIMATLPFLIYLVILISTLFDGLNDYLYPVIVYGVTISIFGIVSLMYLLQNRNKAALYIFLGATIFIASDSMIALNKFYQPKPYYNILVMLTYIVAQFLIYKFMISEKKLLEHV